MYGWGLQEHHGRLLQRLHRPRPPSRATAFVGALSSSRVLSSHGWPPVVPLVNLARLLGSIPYTVLDKLRVEHGIDVTSISPRQTHLGGLYRANVLMTCR